MFDDDVGVLRHFAKFHCHCWVRVWGISDIIFSLFLPSLYHSSSPGLFGLGAFSRVEGKLYLLLVFGVGWG